MINGISIPSKNLESNSNLEGQAVFSAVPDYCIEIQEEQNMESQHPAGVTCTGYQTLRY